MSQKPIFIKENQWFSSKNKYLLNKTNEFWSKTNKSLVKPLFFKSTPPPLAYSLSLMCGSSCHAASTPVTAVQTAKCMYTPHLCCARLAQNHEFSGLEHCNWLEYISQPIKVNGWYLIALIRLRSSARLIEPLSLLVFIRYEPTWLC